MEKWDLDQIGDLTGKTVVITGASSGMGYAAAEFLSGKGANVIMACRNRARAENAEIQIKKKVPAARLTVMDIDLSNLDSVRTFAGKYREKIGRNRKRQALKER